VLGLIGGKMERVPESIDRCLVRDEHEVRVSRKYFLPANRFVLSI
jgi:hypothetical protein